MADAMFCTRPVEGPDASTMANRAVDIGHVCALAGLVGLADPAFGFVLVFVMPQMLRLGGRVLVHAISSHRGPAELEREQCKHKNDDQAAHFLSLARGQENFVRGSAARAVQFLVALLFSG